jgi:hypothetical protein
MVYGALCELISASSLVANRLGKPYPLLSAVQPAGSEQPGRWETKEMQGYLATAHLAPVMAGP